MTTGSLPPRRPSPTSVESALRIRPVDHRADVNRVSQYDANRLALPIDTVSRQDASAFRSLAIDRLLASELA